MVDLVGKWQLVEAQGPTTGTLTSGLLAHAVKKEDDQDTQI